MTSTLRPSMRVNGRAVALIVAAGMGRRLGEDRPKAFVSLTDKLTILQVAVLNAARSEAYSDIVIMVSEDMLGTAQEQVQALNIDVPVKIYPGGVLRSDSVRLGVQRIMARDEEDTVAVIAIHDAARCFTPSDIHAALVDRARAMMEIDYPAAIVPVMPVKDTLKMISSQDQVLGTPNRERLRAVQTPQVFDAHILEVAHEQAAVDGVDTTDDAGLFEAYDIAITATPGSALSYKITDQQDLYIGRLIAQDLFGDE